MNKAHPILLTAALGLVTGCNEVDTSVLVEGIAAPQDPSSCEFTSDGTMFWSSTTLDVFEQKNLRLVARVFNTMPPEPVLVEMAPEESLTLPNRVTPVRFDFRWECDSNGFGAGQGPLFLPQFSVTEPFCLDDRDDTSDFVGFDQVSASGQAANPQAQGLVDFTPIPAQLGIAMDEAFQLATLADACCQEVGGNCNNTPNANLGGPGACADLQALFDTVSGNQLQVVQTADVQRWQPFSIYDGSAPPTAQGARYLLRMRGRFEFVTAAGDELTSNELVHDVGICRNCRVNGVSLTTPCTL